MKVHDPDFLPPSPTAKRILKRELSWVFFILATLLILFIGHHKLGYTRLAQLETKSYGKLVHIGMLNYAQDNDGILPSGFLSPIKMSEKISPYTRRSSLDIANCPGVELTLNPTLSSKSISTLDPKTELFTITNTYMWNNYKVVHHLDGTTTQSDLP